MNNKAKVIPMPLGFSNQTSIPSHSSAWVFNLDLVHPWSHWNKAFTKEECNKIIEIGNDITADQATTFDGNKDNVRKSEVAWLYPNKETEWIYRRMTDIITTLNNKFFQFELFGITEGFQFTKYTAPGGKYGRHIDKGVNMTVRKLSFSVQLSDPEDYKGGDLSLYFKEKGETMNKEQGTVVCFPSYVLHEVTPVTQGTRFSLVSWVTGKPFK